jgi:hypothetical protein
LSVCTYRRHCKNTPSTLANLQLQILYLIFDLDDDHEQQTVRNYRPHRTIVPSSNNDTCLNKHFRQEPVRTLSSLEHEMKPTVQKLASGSLRTFRRVSAPTTSQLISRQVGNPALFTQTCSLESIQHPFSRAIIRHFSEATLGDDHNVPSSLQEIQAFISNNSLDEAYNLLSNIPWTDQSKETNRVRKHLFNACIDQQKSLLKSYDTHQPDRETLKAIILCVDQAHHLLECMAPKLAVYLNLFHPGVTGTTGFHLQQDNTIPLPATTTDINKLLTRQCGDVLQAYAAGMRAAHAVPMRWTRGFPQRAHNLLKRMHAVSRSTDVPEDRVKVTIAHIHAVLTTYAYSREHWRAGTAQELFDNVSTLFGNILPNSESYRIMITAWILSNETKRAFNATKLLMDMVQHLQEGNASMEPTLTMCQDILKLWITAE